MLASSHRATIEAEHRACIEPASSFQHRASIELSASSIEAGASTDTPPRTPHAAARAPESAASHVGDRLSLCRGTFEY